LGGDNAKVGRAIKNDNLKGAVEIILKKIQPFIKDGQIENIPKTFWYEKRVLQHLNRYPNDFAGALRKIPKRILRLYTHAYQSKNFNDMLTTAIKNDKVPKSLIIPGFNISKMPNLGTIPIERKCHLFAKDFKVLKIENGIVKLKFTLGSGEYASTLLSHLVASDR
jgi:tRNA(Glu) U13 pseudouridine synthase TruD